LERFLQARSWDMQGKKQSRQRRTDENRTLKALQTHTSEDLSEQEIKQGKDHY